MKRDDCEAAVRHALLAGDTALAAEIIEAAGGWRRVYATTRGGTLLFQTLIAKAADIHLSAYPLTTLGLSVISAKAGQLDAANHYLAVAERACTSQTLSRDLRVVRVLLSLYTDHWASPADLSALEADLSHGSDMELIHRALALNMLAYNFLIRTDLERAMHYGQLAMRAFRDGGADFGAMHLYTHIGQAAFFSGDSASAEDAYRSLIAEAQSNIGEGSDLDAVGQVLLSEVLSMRGEHDAASAALSWALPHLERHDTWFDLLAAGFMAQQRVLRLNGDVLAAHAAIDSARAAALPPRLRQADPIDRRRAGDASRRHRRYRGSGTLRRCQWLPGPGCLRRCCQQSWHQPARLRSGASLGANLRGTWRHCARTGFVRPPEDAASAEATCAAPYRTRASRHSPVAG
ncbi:hypothetical protein LP421_01460 (plasmid) [Rhizobium sp. RCAM05350]|nr:hypothetical protein LP421_01460 [Rhizobium sp. RCAM05350]